MKTFIGFVSYIANNIIFSDLGLFEKNVIMLVSDLRQVDGFLRVLRFPQPIKLTAMI